MSQQATRKKHSSEPLYSVHLARGLREALLFILAAVAVYMLLALASYHPSDPGWSRSGMEVHTLNYGGRFGAWFSDVLLYLFGYFAYLFPIMAGYAGWLVYRDKAQDGGFDWRRLAFRSGGFVATLVTGTALAALHFTDPLSPMPFHSGGILGDFVSGGLVRSFSATGATLLVLAVFLGGVTLFTGLSWFRVMEALGRWTLLGYEYAMVLYGQLRERLEVRRVLAEREQVVEKTKRKIASVSPAPPRIEPVIAKIEPSVRATEERQREMFDHPSKGSLPSLDLLDKATPQTKSMSREELEAMSRLVELKLLDFGIQVQVVAVHPGPVITRFEMQPAAGIKVSQITNLAKDLARAMSVISVRIVEVIPGKPYVGLEIPNEQRAIVRLGEIIESRNFAEMGSPLTLALGKDIGGHPVSVDLARMPHLLVAGTTGSGKSVALNCMVLSLLYNSTPEQVRLIMIDPKMLELSVYEGIPHLLAPVVTDMKQAAYALRWCTVEMDRRYRLLAAVGVRNIGGYNRKVKEAIDAGTPMPDPTQKLAPGEEQRFLEPLPYIVVIVDELADMMMLVGKKVEELIARLAQKARASGIHLILATQRPSVDVLTGLIKANIPTRIAFQVSSRIDSRTILDQMGAEQLLGHGDMLYLPPGTGVPVRVHGAFVDDHEVHRIVKDLRKRGAPEYLDEILSGDNSADVVPGSVDAFGEPVGEVDELYDMAVRIVTETRRASVSAIQRRLKIGYNRAARMVEDMERAGVVGSLQSNGMREVLAPPPPGAAEQ